MSDHQGQFEKVGEQVEAWREEMGVPGLTYGVTVSGKSYTGWRWRNECRESFAGHG